jgi:hypothetical protein
VFAWEESERVEAEGLSVFGEFIEGVEG